jgi:hypothetical protein
MSHWQHNNPLACPKRHKSMLWLGAQFWFCSKCRQIYVSKKPHPITGEQP